MQKGNVHQLRYLWNTQYYIRCKFACFKRDWRERICATIKQILRRALYNNLDIHHIFTLFLVSVHFSHLWIPRKTHKRPPSVLRVARFSQEPIHDNDQRGLFLRSCFRNSNRAIQHRQRDLADSSLQADHARLLRGRIVQHPKGLGGNSRFDEWAARVYATIGWRHRYWHIPSSLFSLFAFLCVFPCIFSWISLEYTLGDDDVTIIANRGIKREQKWASFEKNGSSRRDQKGIFSKGGGSSVLQMATRIERARPLET